MAAPRDDSGRLAYKISNLEAVDETDDGGVYRNGPWQTCVRIIHGNDYNPQTDAALPDQVAVVVDGSGYAARLAVKPDFGCVLWEEKP